MRTLRTLTLSMLLSLNVVAAHASAAIDPAEGTHLYKREEKVAGFRRSFLVHVPTGYDGSEPLPLVVAIHGAFSGARKLERRSGFSDLADREGFIVVYPNGVGIFGLFRHWNSGHCCGKARKEPIDDVGYVLDIVREVTESLNVDRSRTYIVGHSNGGMLTHRIAAERGDLFAAAAVVSATIGGKPPKKEPPWVLPPTTKSIPMMLIHGTDDDSIPYLGSPDPNQKGATLSFARSVDYWRTANRSPADPVVDRDLGASIKRETYGSSPPVVAITLEGWGHDWAGTHFTRKSKDPSLQKFDAAQTVWSFFEEHRSDSR